MVWSACPAARIPSANRCHVRKTNSPPMRRSLVLTVTGIVDGPDVFDADSSGPGRDFHARREVDPGSVFDDSN